jgi:hypothetical protein
MPTLKSILRLTLATAAFMALGITAAWTPGSIPLAEVMEQLKDNQQLIDEVNAELKKQNVDAGKVICVGARFGRRWEAFRRRPRHSLQLHSWQAHARHRGRSQDLRRGGQRAEHRRRRRAD